MTYGTDYLTPDREAQLVAAVFVALPDTDDGISIGDTILCELIEMGLVDVDHAPEALSLWQDFVNEQITEPQDKRHLTALEDIDVFRRVIEAVAKGEDDSYGHCDTCGLPCDDKGCVLDRDHVAALDE